MKMNEIKQIGLRIPADLLEKVKAAADNDGRSVNNYLTRLIEKDVDRVT